MLERREEGWGRFRDVRSLENRPLRFEGLREPAAPAPDDLAPGPPPAALTVSRAA
jgi:hypothetical protein